MSYKSDIERHIYELKVLGFTIIENVVPQSTITKMKKLIDKGLVEDSLRYSKFPSKKNDLIVDLVSLNIEFLEVIENDIFFSFIEKILGDDAILYSFTSTILRPKIIDDVQQIHVDSYKFIQNYDHGLLATIALDDFFTDNGATLYLPGSHNFPYKPDELTFDRYSVSTSRKAGDVIFFNPRVWHKAGYNNTESIRYAITAYFTKSFIKQRFDFPKMLDFNDLNNISEKMLVLLGFNSCPPESVENYYLPLKERKFKRG